MLSAYQTLFGTFLEGLLVKKRPEGLYDPIHYILSLGGKRLRPILTLLAADAYGKNPKDALSAALAVEVFHNFTLLHDDIMDAAPLRRGKPTVHHKWNVNTGILSGDAMLIQSYQLLESYSDPLFGKLSRQLSTTALQVCEGQQYDMEFETQKEVSLEAYLEMIQLKTAVLIGAALKMGAWIGGANDVQAQILYDFGVWLGIAFQIQDDYLDAFGDPESFGKQVGGDIIENKKTILYHLALELGSASDRSTLSNWYAKPTNDSEAKAKIKEVTTIFNTTGAAEATLKQVESFTNKAFEKLENATMPSEMKNVFKAFGMDLMQRKY